MLVPSILTIASLINQTELPTVPEVERICSISHALCREIKCQAENIYHEARGEPTKGQIAVAYVVINRTPKGRSVCNTIRKPFQFSWTLTEQNMKDPKAWKQSLRVAYKVHTGRAKSPFGSVKIKHYVTLSLFKSNKAPKWVRRMDHEKTIGQHAFLRERNPSKTRVRAELKVNF